MNIINNYLQHENVRDEQKCKGGRPEKLRAPPATMAG